MARVHAELLVGRRVRDINDRVVGRIAAIRVVRRGNDYFVDEYLLGPAAFFEVLGISTARMVGVHWPRGPLKIPWDKLDLSDPHHPRFKGAREELKRSR